jgi:hypothetical protein
MGSARGPVRIQLSREPCQIGRRIKQNREPTVGLLPTDFLKPTDLLKPTVGTQTTVGLGLIQGEPAGHSSRWQERFLPPPIDKATGTRFGSM